MINLSRFLFENDNRVNNKFIYDLKQTKEFPQIRELIKNRYNLKQIGEGTTRNVYELDKNKVFKLVKNEKQNENNLVEVEAYKCLGDDYAAKIYDYDSVNYYWLIMERVKIITQGEFQSKLTELIGFPLIKTEIESRFSIDFNNLYTIGDYFYFPDILMAGSKPNTKAGVEYRTLHGLLCENSPWFKEFNNRLVKCGVYAGDLGFVNFGLRLSTDELVLLDYGFQMDEGDQIECH